MEREQPPHWTGTQSQIEWAEQIRPQVEAEFDRVSNILSSAAQRQDSVKQAETQILIGIVAEKRAEVLAHASAGYFIKEWRDLGAGQVRRMIAADARYQSVLASRAERRQSNL